MLFRLLNFAMFPQEFSLQQNKKADQDLAIFSTK